MLDAIQTRALVGAVLITSVIQGALLLAMNDVAAQGAAMAVPAVAPAVAGGPEAPRVAMRQLTLEPVTIVGKHSAYPDALVRPVSQREDCKAGFVRVSITNDARLGAINAC